MNRVRSTAATLLPHAEPASGPRRIASAADARRPPPVSLLVFGLSFVGGILGGTVGGGALVLDQRIASSGAPSWITLLAIVAVTSGAVVLLCAALWLIHALTREVRGVTASDT